MLTDYSAQQHKLQPISLAWKIVILFRKL